MNFPWSEEELLSRICSAVKSYWSARGDQKQKQAAAGITDTGARSEVTGGQHLDEFCGLLVSLVEAAGFTREHIRIRAGVELPGYFRPTKKWDLIVVREGRLCAAVEMKSQVGPSFGNNFNNRTEEAVGSAEDFWVAFREGRLGLQQPWLGYLL